jgi:hypothetical protein
MFVGKATAYTSKAPFRCHTLGKALGPTNKYYTVDYNSVLMEK